MNPVLFGILAVLLIASALGVVLSASPIRSALSLIMALFFIAVEFLFLDAQLVAVLQIVVYAGAIMVLFLFVIMLLNLQHDPQAMARLPVRIAAACLGGLFLLAALHFFITPGISAGAGINGAVPAAFGSTESLAEMLFTRFLFAFEITSLLLLVAIIGAVVLAKKNLT